MAKKFSQTRRNAFLTALAQTGNQTLAAEVAKVSRSWVTLNRGNDPGFDSACREAIRTAAEGAQALRDAAGAAPQGERRGRSKWAYASGAELVVRNSGGSQPKTGQAGDPSTGSGRTEGRERGRPQIVRARLNGWSPRTEARFIAALTATCNVKAACAEVGLTPTAAYNHRNKWPAFARRWDSAIRFGYDQIEFALLGTGLNHFGGEDNFAEPPPIIGMTAAHAIHVLHMHKHLAHGLGRRPGLPQRMASAEEVRAVIERKIAVIKRVKARAELSSSASTRSAAAGRSRSPAPG